MKLNLYIVAIAIALSACSLQAQQDNGNTDNQPPRNRGNFDPAQMQQRMMENIRAQLNFTNDTDWSAVQPLVQKVMDARREASGAGMRGMFGGRNRGQGGQGGANGMFGQPSTEQAALQNAIDGNAPTAQIKDLLAKYKASQKAKQAKLEAAQDELKAILSAKQEAQACLLGLVR